MFIAVLFAIAKIQKKPKKPSIDDWIKNMWGVCVCVYVYIYMGFPCGSTGKESACNAGDMGPIPGLGRCPGGWKGYPLQCSRLENSMGCIVHRVPKSQTRLSDFPFHIYIYIKLE